MRPDPDNQPPFPQWKGLQLPSVPQEHRGQSREGHATRSWRATLRGLSPTEILRREAREAKALHGKPLAAARQPRAAELLSRLRRSRLALALMVLLVGVVLPVVGLQMGAWSAQQVDVQPRPTPEALAPSAPSSGGVALVPPSPTFIAAPAPPLPATAPPEQAPPPPSATSLPSAPTAMPGTSATPPPATAAPPLAPTATPGPGATQPPAAATPPPSPTATPPSVPTVTPPPAAPTSSPASTATLPPAAPKSSPTPTATP